MSWYKNTAAQLINYIASIALFCTKAPRFPFPDIQQRNQIKSSASPITNTTSVYIVSADKQRADYVFMQKKNFLNMPAKFTSIRLGSLILWTLFEIEKYIIFFFCWSTCRHGCNIPRHVDWFLYSLGLGYRKMRSGKWHDFCNIYIAFNVYTIQGRRTHSFAIEPKRAREWTDFIGRFFNLFRRI